MKMRNTLFIALLVVTVSCDLPRTFEKINIIQEDLSSTFNHDKILVTMHWGTGEDSDYCSVIFYQYHLHSVVYDTLEIRANRIADQLLKDNMELRDLDYIEVRFTDKKDPENDESFVTFKIRKNG